VLLLKDDVGRSKPNTHALPRDMHTYGKAEARDQEDAAAGKISIKFRRNRAILNRFFKTANPLHFY
jgi:hypothetical protein